MLFPRARRRAVATQAIASAALGSMGWALAGAACVGILVGLLLAKAAQAYLMGHFDPNKANRENAVLRAKVRESGGRCRTAGHMRAHAGAGASRLPWPRDAIATRAGTATAGLLLLLRAGAAAAACRLARAGWPCCWCPPSRRPTPAAAMHCHHSPPAQVEELQQMVVKFEPMAYKNMSLRFTRVRPPSCVCGGGGGASPPACMLSG